MQKHLHRLVPPILFVLFLGLSPLTAQQWDTLAPVPERLTFPVASVLNGEIHVIGGGGTGGASSAHYSYDPATNAWTTRAPLPYLAQQPAGASVNGKIHHFGGGFPNSGSPVDDHFIYNPVLNSWSPGTGLTAPRAIHSGVGLNGQLYSLGGQGMARLVQVYDTTTNTWITKNDLPDNSFWYGAHVPAGGKLYRFGGGGYTAPVKFAHQYDPATDSWTAIPNLPNAVHAIKGAAIGNKIFLAGGYYNFADTDEVLIYDIVAQSYSYTTPLPRGRSYHNVVAIDSCVYVIGGNNPIDPDISFQLLRFCPFETSATSAPGQPLALTSAGYRAGYLQVWVPEKFAEQQFQIQVSNAAGQLLLSEVVMPDGSGLAEAWLGAVPASVYFIQVYSGKTWLTGKVFVQP